MTLGICHVTSSCVDTLNQTITIHLFVCLVKVSSSGQYFVNTWERFRVSLAIAVVPPNDTRHLSRNQLMRGHPDKWSQPLTHAGHHFKWVTLQHQAPKKKRRRGWVKNLWLKGLLLSKSGFFNLFILFKSESVASLNQNCFDMITKYNSCWPSFQMSNIAISSPPKENKKKRLGQADLEDYY